MPKDEDLREAYEEAKANIRTEIRLARAGATHHPPTYEEHPPCEDPDCIWCSDEAYYRMEDTAEEYRRGKDVR